MQKKSRKRKPDVAAAVVAFFFVAAGAALLILNLRYKENSWELKLTLKGEKYVHLECGEPYEEPGAEAFFRGTVLQTAPVPVAVKIEGGEALDCSKPGQYTLTYSAAYYNGTKATETRFVEFIDSGKPTISLEGANPFRVVYGSEFQDPGYSAKDAIDGDLTDRVKITQTEDKVYYEVSDNTGNMAFAERQLIWVDMTPPVLTLKGELKQTLSWDEEYREEGFTAVDNHDGDISSRVERIADRDKIVYRVSDAAGNKAEAVRELYYVDDVPPVITLNGDSYYSIGIGEDFWDPGFSAWDSKDGDLTDMVVVDGEFDCWKMGTTTVEYSVTDAAGNRASVTRTLEVTLAYTGDIYDVWPEPKTLYVTFDDGPGPNTYWVLDILDRHNAKATFFVCGTAYADAIADIVDQGHAVGVHCFTHYFNRVYASDEAYFNDFFQMRNYIHDISGVWTTIFRFPGGSSNLSSAEYCPGLMSRLTEVMPAMGFKYFDWNVAAGDSGGNSSREAVFDRITSEIPVKGDVAVILMHENYDYSVEALEDLLTWGEENGYTFKALDMTSPGFHHDVLN